MIIVLLLGNLGGDPEVRFSAAGTKITSFSVASNSKRQGKEETTWTRVVIFGDHLDKMVSFLKKGSSVVIDGSLHLNKWTDKEGREQTTLEVTADNIRFSPFGRPTEQGQAQSQAQGQGQAQRAPAAPIQPSFSQAQPGFMSSQQAQPFEMHDFSFGNAPAENLTGNYEDTPF